MQTLNTDTTILSSSEEAEFLPLKQMITKKTLRGRKIKSPLPQEQRCSICLEFSNSSSEPLISCNVCKAILHSSCYHKEIPSAENFICERCLEANEQKRELSSYHCFICDQCDGILVKNLFCKTNKNQTFLIKVINLFYTTKIGCKDKKLLTLQVINNLFKTIIK